MLIECLETKAHNISFPHLMPLITVYLLRSETKSEKFFSYLVYHMAFYPLLLDISKTHRKLDSLSITSFLWQSVGLFIPCKAKKLPHQGKNVKVGRSIQHTQHMVLLMLQVIHYFWDTAYLAHPVRKISSVHHKKLDPITRRYPSSLSACPAKFISETKHLCNAHIFCGIS